MDYKKILKSKKLRLQILRMLDFIPDKLMVSIQYRIKLGRKLNTDQLIFLTLHMVKHFILEGLTLKMMLDTVYNIPGYESGSDVVFSYLQEVKDGEVVWEWKSIDYPELYEQVAIHSMSQNGVNNFVNANGMAPDYIHFNSMDLDAEGNLICSFRHIHALLCLDRSAKENQILWTLSGAADEFGLTEIQKSSAQHTACAVYLKRTNRKGWMLWLPMGVMLAVTLTALGMSIVGKFGSIIAGTTANLGGDLLQGCFAVALFALGVMVAVQGIRKLWGKKTDNP